MQDYYKALDEFNKVAKRILNRHIQANKQLVKTAQAQKKVLLNK